MSRFLSILCLQMVATGVVLVTSDANAQPSCRDDCAPSRYNYASLSGIYKVCFSPGSFTDAELLGMLGGIATHWNTPLASRGINIYFQYEPTNVGCDILVYPEELLPNRLAEAHLTTDGRGAAVAVNRDFVGNDTYNDIMWSNVMGHEFGHLMDYKDVPYAGHEGCQLFTIMFETVQPTHFGVNLCADDNVLAERYGYNGGGRDEEVRYNEGGIECFDVYYVTDYYYFNDGWHRWRTVWEHSYSYCRLLATGCDVTLSPLAQSVGSSASAQSFEIAAPSSCQWNAISNANFIGLSGATSGSGNGVITFQVKANEQPLERVGKIVVGDESYTLTQAESQPLCAFSLAPSTASFGSAGASGQVSVTTTPAGCKWFASPIAHFISITSANGGSGGGTVSYHVEANSGFSVRRGTLTVAGETFEVEQAGASPPPTLPASCNFSDDPLVAGGSIIRAAHIVELRTCINDLRARRSLAAVAWTDPSVYVQQLVIRAVHLNELRAGLIDVYVADGLVPPQFGPAIVPSVTTVSAAHLMALRDAIRTLGQ